MALDKDLLPENLQSRIICPANRASLSILYQAQVAKQRYRQLILLNFADGKIVKSQRLVPVTIPTIMKSGKIKYPNL